MSVNTKPEGNIQLKWTNHQPTIFNIFQNLLNLESLVDVTLAVEGKYLRAHKVILSACSPYFQELLSLDSSKHPILFMSPDTKFKEVRAILDYMYKGETAIRHEDLPALLKLAESLQVRGLAETDSDSPRPPSNSASVPTTRSPHDQPQPPPLPSMQIALPPKPPEISSMEENSGSDQFRQGHIHHRSPGPSGSMQMPMTMSRKIHHSDPISFLNVMGSATSSSSPPAAAPMHQYKRPRRDIPNPILLPNSQPQPPISSTSSNAAAIPMQIVRHTSVEDVSPNLVSGVSGERDRPYQNEPPPGFHGNNLGVQEQIHEQEYDPQHQLNLAQVKVEVGLTEEVATIDVNSSDHITVRTGLDYGESEDNEEEQGWNNMPVAVQVGEFRSPGPSHMNASNTRDSGDSMFECPKCLRSYIRKSSLSRHITYECDLPPKFECSFCGLKMKLKSNLRVHMKRCTNLLREKLEKHYQ